MNQPTPQKVMRRTEVQACLGVGVTKLYALINKGIVPAPAHLGKTSIWFENEILAVQNRLIAERDAARAEKPAA